MDDDKWFALIMIIAIICGTIIAIAPMILL